CRRNARWTRTTGSTLRTPSGGGTPSERVVLERSDLRSTRAGPEHGRAVAARGGMPRVRSGRGNVVRNAQWLSRSGARGASARCPERGVLHSRPMIDALLDLPPYLRDRLASALDAGLLTAPYSGGALRSALGGTQAGDKLLAALLEMERLGVAGS